MSRAVRVADWRFTSGSPVWVRSAWVLGGTRRGGWVLRCWVVSRLQVNALCCPLLTSAVVSLLCGLSHRQSQQSQRCNLQSTFFLAYPLIEIRETTTGGNKINWL